MATDANPKSARSLHKLSARGVATITKPGRHGDGGGLYLSISATGARSWTFLFRDSGRRHEMGLGPFPTITLARARDMAADLRLALAEGRNPLRDRQATAKAVPTFKTYSDDYIAAHAPGWKSAKHAAQWTATLDAHAAPLHRLAIDRIGTEDVLACLKPIWATIPETASRVRGRIESILDGARAKGLRHGENPARWKGHLENLLPARTRLSRGHMAAMAWQRIPAFFATLNGDTSISAAALEFLILTATRSGETRGAVWAEIDLSTAVWTIPAERMKMTKPHRVPLSPRVLELLKIADTWRDKKSDLVFPGARSGSALSDMALTQFLRKRQIKETVHGFRSSFRDWAGDTTEFPRELIEEALAHSVGNAVERAYRRSDALEKRRALMEVWATYCGGANGE